MGFFFFCGGVFFFLGGGVDFLGLRWVFWEAIFSGSKVSAVLIDFSKKKVKKLGVKKPPNNNSRLMDSKSGPNGLQIDYLQ